MAWLYELKWKNFGVICTLQSKPGIKFARFFRGCGAQKLRCVLK